MSESTSTSPSGHEPAAATSPDPVEIAMEALAAGAVPDSTARTLLQRQTRLIEMQIQQILLRRWLVAVLAVLLALGMAALLWNAARDRSLVIESFSTPPDLDGQGLGGEMLASLLLDKLTAIDAQTESLRARETLANDWAGDIKVEIPNTGVSLGQLDRGLHHWLGHQNRIEGGVYHRDDHLVLTLRAVGGAAHSYSGQARELDGLLQQAAEALFADTQPYLFSKYLEQHGRMDEALAVARKGALAGPDEERAWSYAQVSNLLGYLDLPGAIVAARKALQIDPQNGLAYLNLSTPETLLGHDEDGVRDLRDGAALLKSGRSGLSSLGLIFGVVNEAILDDFTGDFAGSVAIYRGPASKVTYEGYDRLMPGLTAYELAKNHDVAASRAVDSQLADTEMAGFFILTGDAIVPGYERSAALADWPAALADLDQTIAATHTLGYVGAIIDQRLLTPRRIYALAKSGRIAEAAQLASALPADCYRCVRVRSMVAAVAGDAAASERWFDEAVKLAPSLPFAYSEWGEARLARGDAAGAITLFRQAQEKGPAWADPLKLEGDALMSSGKAADALPRYAAAAERAPHWGALQLAWGRALDALGRKAEARDRYLAAAGMDLSTADRAMVQSLVGKK